MQLHKKHAKDAMHTCQGMQGQKHPSAPTGAPTLGPMPFWPLGLGMNSQALKEGMKRDASCRLQVGQ